MPGIVDAGVERGHPQNLGLEQHGKTLLHLHGRCSDVEWAHARQLEGGREVDRQSVQHRFGGRLAENGSTFGTHWRGPRTQAESTSARVGRQRIDFRDVRLRPRR